jgi:hypothetical protein
MSRSEMPTCGARQPMPTSSYIVSVMSGDVALSSGVTVASSARRSRSADRRIPRLSERPFDRIDLHINDTPAPRARL